MVSQESAGIRTTIGIGRSLTDPSPTPPYIRITYTAVRQIRSLLRGVVKQIRQPQTT